MPEALELFWESPKQQQLVFFGKGSRDKSSPVMRNLPEYRGHYQAERDEMHKIQKVCKLDLAERE